MTAPDPRIKKACAAMKVLGCKDASVRRVLKELGRLMKKIGNS